MTWGRSPALPAADRETIRSVGLAAGLAAVGFATAEPFAEARATLEARKAQGLHAGMQFTFRNPARSTTPEHALAGARTLIAAAYRYPTAADPTTSDLVDAAPGSEPRARIAAYAWDDHYRDLRIGLEAMAERLRADGAQARVLADDNALVDRSAAVRAGLGWFGKNSNVLLPGQGSWFVLGAVLTTTEYEPDQPVEVDCGGCTRCFAGCPTGAIVADGVLDARRCLAWLLQAKDFPPEFREALGDRIYGCDDCQDVCPPNRAAAVRFRSGRSTDRSADGSTDTGQQRPGEPHALVRDTGVHWLLTADDDELLDRHGRWYIPDRDLDYLRRNALIVLGNVGDRSDPATATLIGRYLGDKNPILRAHAVWAAKRLGLDDAVVSVTNDRSEHVRAELDRPVVARADV